MIPPETTSKEKTDMTTAGGPSERSGAAPAATRPAVAKKAGHAVKVKGLNAYYGSQHSIKNVTIDEYYFQGHFPARPVMPGVLIIEAMAQTAAVLVVHTLGPEAEGKLVYFMSVDNARFRRPVVPGDCLEVRVTKQRNRGNVWKFEGRAEVRGQLMAEAVFAAMIMDD